MAYDILEKKRNEAMTDGGKEIEKLAGEIYALTKKHSYDQMMRSFKPLKLEFWYTEQEIRMLKGGEK